MSFLLSFVIIVTVVSEGLTSCAGEACNPVTGPAGINRCVLLNGSFPHYNSYQWAACLPNEYIKVKTGGKHECMDSSANFCWFQCSLELYDSRGPEVNNVCMCNENIIDSTSSLSGSTVAIPQVCYAPNGSDCDWYIDCLEGKYPCKGTKFGYAVEYGSEFCQLYNGTHDKFSPAGQRWVDAIRKCLQLALVPLLSQNVAPTCSQIRETAFASHVSCYLRPGVGAPSVCDLPLADYLEIMWTTKSAFLDLTTASEAVCSGLEAFRDCSNQWADTRPCLRAFTVDVGIIYNSAMSISSYVGLKAADLATTAIGRLMKWDSQKLKIIGCLSEWLEPTRGFLNILVAVPDHINCLTSLVSSTSKRSVSSVNLDDVEIELKNAVRNGSLLMRVGDVALYVHSVGECDSLSCSNMVTRNVFAPPPPVAIATDSGATLLRSTRLAAAAALASFSFLVIISGYRITY